MMAREGDIASTEDEGNPANEKGSNPPPSSGLSSWARLKDPRIVRVSRAFGGKDRHSKVRTVRGLRDRRVRLSVPTAIQLYDLQDRLGLNQPSKAVDWLLNAAKHEIDELPPLQMPPANLMSHNLESILASQSAQNLEPNGSDPWISDALLRNKSKEVLVIEPSRDDKDTWTTRIEEGYSAYGSKNEFLSDIHGHHSPTPPGLTLLNSSEQPFVGWNASTLSLAQLGSSRMRAQAEDSRRFNVLPTGPPGTQVLLYQPAIAQSYYASNTAATEEDYVPRQFNFHMLNSSSENQLSTQQGRPYDSIAPTRAPPDPKDHGHSSSSPLGFA